MGERITRYLGEIIYEDELGSIVLWKDHAAAVRKAVEEERERWIAKVVKVEVAGGERPEEKLYVELRRQRDGSRMWVVTQFTSGVLNKDGEWEYEPQPSSRDDAFIARTRWATFDEALAAAIRRRGDA